MPEPTVLDYVKAKLTFWRPSVLRIDEPVVDEGAATGENPVVAVSGEEAGTPTQLAPAVLMEKTGAQAVVFPWRIALALVAALIAQMALEPPLRGVWVGVWFYVISAAFLILGIANGEWQIPALRSDEREHTSFAIRWEFLLIGAVLSVLIYIAFGVEQFTPLNLFIWMAAIGFTFRSFWMPKVSATGKKKRFHFSIPQRVNITLTWEIVLIAALIGLVVFFRVDQLKSVPAEMVSDHAEKLLDVQDVVNGSTAVYFPRNTGREAFQFYLTAALVKLFNLPIDFLTLKFGTVLCGLLTLPFIYLLGKELANKRVGLYAALFAGIAFWPNIFSRIALRFTLYPFFAAPCLYYLLRGLRRQNRNDFILSGVFLGLGLYGYTSFRIMPFVVVLAVMLYLIHRQSQGARYQTLVGFAALTAISIVIFLPLGRYAVDHPDLFEYRAFSRLSGLEQPLPGSPVAIFFSNLWNAVTMFFWSDGNTWVHSVIYRPALDVVSAALFFLGLCLLVVRYVRTRHWTDPFLILAVPMMMMPSILSLAFPNENPSLNRTSGAIIPVFLIVAIGLDATLSSLKSRLPVGFGQRVAGLVFVLLLAWSVTSNYNLVFEQYATEYRKNAWNYTEVAQVIRSYAASIGSFDTAWVVAYPYWYDTRLIAIEAGETGKDDAIWPDQILNTASDPRTKLFIVNPQDEKGIATLHQLYPQATQWTHTSSLPGKDFLMFLVPAGS